MPTSDKTLQTELLNGMEMLDTDVPVSISCPTCRSGIIMIPPAIVTDVVNVEL